MSPLSDRLSRRLLRSALGFVSVLAFVGWLHLVSCPVYAPPVRFLAISAAKCVHLSYWLGLWGVSADVLLVARLEPADLYASLFCICYLCPAFLTGIRGRVRVDSPSGRGFW